VCLGGICDVCEVQKGLWGYLGVLGVLGVCVKKETPYKENFMCSQADWGFNTKIQKGTIGGP